MLKNEVTFAHFTFHNFPPWAARERATNFQFGKFIWFFRPRFHSFSSEQQKGNGTAVECVEEKCLLCLQVTFLPIVWQGYRQFFISPCYQLHSIGKLAVSFKSRAVGSVCVCMVWLICEIHGWKIVKCMTTIWEWKMCRSLRHIPVQKNFFPPPNVSRDPFHYDYHLESSSYVKFIHTNFSSARSRKICKRAETKKIWKTP